MDVQLQHFATCAMAGVGVFGGDFAGGVDFDDDGGDWGVLGGGCFLGSLTTLVSTDLGLRVTEVEVGLGVSCLVILAVRGGDRGSSVVEVVRFVHLAVDYVVQGSSKPVPRFREKEKGLSERMPARAFPGRGRILFALTGGVSGSGFSAISVSFLRSSTWDLSELWHSNICV